jgi:hypothetical protein
VPLPPGTDILTLLQLHSDTTQNERARENDDAFVEYILQPLTERVNPTGWAAGGIGTERDVAGLCGLPSFIAAVAAFHLMSDKDYSLSHSWPKLLQHLKDNGITPDSG